MKIQDIQKEIAEWGQYNFPNSEPNDKLMGVMEELGELCHAVLKRKQKIRGTKYEHDAAEADAIADLFIFLCHYCSLRGLNLEAIILQTWNQVKQRDWIKFPKNGLTE